MTAPCYRLANGDEPGIACDEDGFAVGGVALLARAADMSEAAWRLRPLDEINRELTAAYGLPIDVAAKAAALTSIGKALDRGEVALAQLIALHLRWPDPPPLAKANVAPDEAAELALRLMACGLLKADWNPAQHPRWPAGTPGSIGGQFSPAGDGGSAAGFTGPSGSGGGEAGPPEPRLTLTPAQITMPLPLPWESPVPEALPIPSEITPPPIIGPLLRNPYPTRPECVKEWKDAEDYCRKLADKKWLGKGDYREHGKTYDQCVMGQVSQDCGGNVVST